MSQRTSYESSGPAFDADPSSALNELVRSAAYAVGCPVAVCYEETADALWPVACFGTPCPPLYESSSVLWEAAGEDAEAPLLINDLRVEKTLPAPAIDFGSGEVRFMALVPVRDGARHTRGVLLVADSEAHAGLSAAQLHVLRTHAAQVNFHCEWRGVREQRAAMRSAASERLRLLESVVVHAKDAVLITEAEPVDMPGPRIVYCNTAFTRTTGYAEAEVLGRTPRILQSKKTDRAALDRIRTALRRWQPIEVELINARKDGTPFWVELSIVPVADERGWFTHWISVQRDVTERKRAEEVANQARIAESEKIALEAQLRERKRAQDMLTYAAFHDDLTKLYNRAYVMDRLRAVLDRERRSPAAVLFLDMDRFKLVNDSLGHRAGDLLLMQMARRLEECMRDGDTLARVGGDEFVVLMENATQETAAMALARRIIDRLRRPFRISGQDIFASCSIGIVALGEDYSDPEALLRDADIAMYAAKASGADQFSVFTGAMREQAVAAMSLQNDLRQAIAEEQFTLYYQPIWRSSSREMTGVEALIRWAHPRRGWVGPGEFIALAEHIGVVRDIGRWVMRAALTQMQQWVHRFPTRALRLSVNVSGQELLDPDFVAELRRTLVDTGFPAARLQLEVTENVFLHEPDRAGAVLESIRAMGVRVALDDFGTGYSSLAYIDRYPIDTIKVDRDFVQRMITVRRTLAIVESILGLGRALDLNIIAEGVETPAQLEMLQSMGCPMVQGFLLDRPMPAEALEARLAAVVGG